MTSRPQAVLLAAALLVIAGESRAATYTVASQTFQFNTGGVSGSLSIGSVPGEFATSIYEDGLAFQVSLNSATDSFGHVAALEDVVASLPIAATGGGWFEEPGGLAPADPIFSSGSSPPSLLWFWLSYNGPLLPPVQTDALVSLWSAGTIAALPQASKQVQITVTVGGASVVLPAMQMLPEPSLALTLGVALAVVWAGARRRSAASD